MKRLDEKFSDYRDYEAAEEFSLEDPHTTWKPTVLWALYGACEDDRRTLSATSAWRLGEVLLSWRRSWQRHRQGTDQLRSRRN